MTSSVAPLEQEIESSDPCLLVGGEGERELDERGAVCDEEVDELCARALTRDILHETATTRDGQYVDVESIGHGRGPGCGMPPARHERREVRGG